MKHLRHVGNRFGDLTLVSLCDERGKNHRFYGVFRCECGNEKRLAVSRVINGQRSGHCGCKSFKGKRTHGMRKSREYSTWSAMRGRCCNPSHKDFPSYGGRGISVCPEWVASFSAFYEHVGPRPVGTTLDRIDGRGNYEPGNVRWATLREQAQNRDCTTIVRTPSGTMALVDYARMIGLTRGAAHLRLKRGKLDGVTYA